MPAPAIAAAAATRLAGSFAMRMGGVSAARAAMRATPYAIRFMQGPGGKALMQSSQQLMAGNSVAGAGNTLSRAVPMYMPMSALSGQSGGNGISFGKAFFVAAAAGAGYAAVKNYLNQNDASQLANSRQMVLNSANSFLTNHLNAVAQRINIPQLGNVINYPALAAQQNME